MAEISLDPESFHRLEPRDQAFCLLALLFMESKDMTLDDLREEFEHEKEKAKYD